MEFYRLPSVSTTIFPYSFASLATPEMDPLRLTFFFFFFSVDLFSKAVFQKLPHEKSFFGYQKYAVLFCCFSLRFYFERFLSGSLNSPLIVPLGFSHLP